MPFSCFLFRPRKSREKRRKRSHTNVSNALVTRPSTPPAQTAHVRFHRRKRVHTRLSEKDRTQGLTRRNRGHFGWGRYHYPRHELHVHEHPRRPGVRTANFAASGSWPGALQKNAESLRNSDALMRVAVPRRRGPAGLRDPVAIVSMIKNMINPWAGLFLIFCWANANSIKKVVLQPF